MLHFIGKTKRSMSEGKSNGEEQRYGQLVSLTGSNPGGAMGKKAKGINSQWAIANRKGRFSLFPFGYSLIPISLFAIPL